MPMNKAHYPKDWNAISARIRWGRAGGACEQCGALHGTWIVRYQSDPSKFTTIENHRDGIRLYDDIAIYPAVKVILTVHHKGIPKPDGTAGDPRDKMDCRDENLIALCQRCHLLADRQLRKQRK